jgi:hypothetical protein
LNFDSGDILTLLYCISKFAGEDSSFRIFIPKFSSLNVLGEFGLDPPLGEFGFEHVLGEFYIELILGEFVLESGLKVL